MLKLDKLIHNSASIYMRKNKSLFFEFFESFLIEIEDPNNSELHRRIALNLCGSEDVNAI